MRISERYYLRCIYISMREIEREGNLETPVYNSVALGGPQNILTDR